MRAKLTYDGLLVSHCGYGQPTCHYYRVAIVVA
jgi:hypothetical protein